MADVWIEYHTAFLAIMILTIQCHIATADPDDGDRQPPFILDACNGAVCGRGNCVASTNTTLGFACECEDGWMQARPIEANFLDFLPCVIPNCTLNYTCAESGPFREYPNNPNNPYIPNNPYDPNNPSTRNGPYNLSFYNPCSFNNCGGGVCNITSPFTHTCICREGFYNLFNASIFPCYRECAFGAGCSGLGINTTTSVLDPNPLLLHNGASLMHNAEIGCLIVAVTTLTKIVWKLN